MIIYLTWKDPDFADQLNFDNDFQKLDHKAQDEVLDLIRDLGLGEYLDIAVDTETKTVRVILLQAQANKG